MKILITARGAVFSLTFSELADLIRREPERLVVETTAEDLPVRKVRPFAETLRKVG